MGAVKKLRKMTAYIPNTKGIFMFIRMLNHYINEMCPTARSIYAWLAIKINAKNVRSPILFNIHKTCTRGNILL